MNASPGSTGRGGETGLRDFLLAAGRAEPDRPAIVEPAPDGGFRTLTYRRLEELVDEYADALRGLGLDIGDRVVLESTTTGEAVAALLACATLGLPFIPSSPDLPLKRLLTIVEIARPALFLQPADGARDGIPGTVGTARFDIGGLTVEHPPVPRTRHRRELVGTDPAYIFFTSGTTGRPKGVVMSHRANIAFYRGTGRQGIIKAGDRVAVTPPFHFDFCLAGLALTLSVGATVVTVPRAKLDWPRRLVDHLRDTRTSHVLGVPSIWRPVLRHEPELLAGLDALDLVAFSGEEFPLPELRELQRLLPGRRIVNAYGATESMAASFTLVPDPIPDDLERLSIGFAHPGAEMTLCDESGRPITGDGVPGEIFLRGPSLFSGYWADPESTRATLVPDPLEPDSGQLVLRTGDLAYRGKDGELYFLGRVDSQVQIRGNRVELGEIERRILECPGVAAAVVLVSPGSSGDGELSAFVVLKPGADDLDVVALRSFCAETLPAYMAPRDLRIVPELPVTPNGKVDRTALLAQAG